MMFCRIDTYILSLVVITNDVYMKESLLPRFNEK